MASSSWLPAVENGLPHPPGRNPNLAPTVCSPNPPSPPLLFRDSRCPHRGCCIPPNFGGHFGYYTPSGIGIDYHAV
ncbi:hypothetical protein M5K25_001795 [Dendrobium thyrsiflorum]|uniref:Uncharacterized protein n=1 Tax=Dendrobium thyrsiflorum TaxID=117978 RepID=A0ABD0VST8_DENTH